MKKFHSFLLKNKYKTTLLSLAYLMTITLVFVLITGNGSEMLFSGIAIMTSLGFMMIILYPIFYILKKIFKKRKWFRKIFIFLYLFTNYCIILGGFLFIVEICFMRSFILGGGDVAPIYFIFPGLAFNYALISE